MDSLRYPIPSVLWFPAEYTYMRCFFSRACHRSGVFPMSPWLQVLVRDGGEAWQDLKPVYLVTLGRFLSYFLWAVRTAPGETPVFRSIRDCGRNQCFRCFCGSVGQRNPRSRSPFPFFFLPFLHFCPVRVHIRSVSRLRDTKCSLQQRASMTDTNERNAEIALSRIGVKFITMV